jgi:hypothetical protein
VTSGSAVGGRLSVNSPMTDSRLLTTDVTRI